MKTLLERLGYARSPHFYAPDRADELPPGELAFALRSAPRACAKIGESTSDVRVEGLYVLQRRPKSESPAIPVVYVVRVDSDEAARRVHQFVWNQNVAPFLIVESPRTVRIYSGFAFDPGADDKPLLQVARDAADVLERLADFRSASIDDSTLWSSQWARAVDPSRRVDQSLLADLEKLDRHLQRREGLKPLAAHGLIGRYVYLRFLRDRNILSDKKLRDRWGIDPDDVFSRRPTLKAFREVNRRLEDWLNGSAFLLGEEELERLTAAQLRCVAGVFSGESPNEDGSFQGSLFDKYDFSQLPIETLSSVYEQFLHGESVGKGSDAAGGDSGKELGAYYTPLPLTEFVLSEMDRRRPLRRGMTVLDPACGSGVFLVQSYRRLIEHERRLARRELKATEVRELLTEHVFGIDRDVDACRVAELSLLLTLLDYVNPPDLESTSFKLPCLRGRNILEGDFFQASGVVADLLDRRKFDWIVGNPPWFEIKKRPAPDHGHFPAYKWMHEHKKTHPTMGRQVAEAFVWKGVELLATDGVCGLIVPAMTWFKSEAAAFREKLFAERHVWCVANFANLAYRLFGGRSQRAASAVFLASHPPEERSTVLSFAPFVADQMAADTSASGPERATWNIIVVEDRIGEVPVASARDGDALTWKIAMWGTSRDQKLLQRVAARFADETLETLATTGRIAGPTEGLQLRNASTASSEPMEFCQELVGRYKLNMGEFRGARRAFALPAGALSKLHVDECHVRKGRVTLPLSVCRPPHVIVDAARRFAIYSDDFVVVPPRQIGISGPAETSDFLKALSLLLSSDFAVYHQFFRSPQWGIDANRADLSALRQFPAPLNRLSPSELQEWAQLQGELALESTRLAIERASEQDAGAVLDSLMAELNRRVASLLELRESERWLIEGFVHSNMKLNKGKRSDEVMCPPVPVEMLDYLRTMRDCLDEFLTIDRQRRHRIDVLSDRKSALISVSLERAATAIEPRILDADQPASRDLQRIREQLLKKHSQWTYFDRGMKVYRQGALYQFKPLERLRWTRRQALIDSDDVIATTLAEGDSDE